MFTPYEENIKEIQYRPYRMGYLPDDLVTRAEQELGETEKITQEAISALRKIVLEETKLKCSTRDDYLIQFLRVCKFDLKKAFSRLQNFYHVKKSYPKVYGTFDIPLITRIYESGIVSCLPQRCCDSSAMVILNGKLWDPDRFQFPSIVLALTLAILYSATDPATQVSGIQFVIDGKDGNIKHLRQSVWYASLLAKGLTNTLPIRYKVIHIVNASVALQYLWGILRNFLSEKIRKRVHVHGDKWERLQKFIPKDILPTDYGGINDPHKSSVWFPEEMKRFHNSLVKLANSGYQD